MPCIPTPRPGWSSGPRRIGSAWDLPVSAARMCGRLRCGTVRKECRPWTMRRLWPSRDSHPHLDIASPIRNLSDDRDAMTIDRADPHDDPERVFIPCDFRNRVSTADITAGCRIWGKPVAPEGREGLRWGAGRTARIPCFHPDQIFPRPMRTKTHISTAAAAAAATMTAISESSSDSVCSGTMIG